MAGFEVTPEGRRHHSLLTLRRAKWSHSTHPQILLQSQFDIFWQPGLTVSVKITLTNALGHKSNELTGSFQS